MGKTLENISNPMRNIKSLFQQFIFGLIWFISIGWIDIATALLYWIPAYLIKYLTIGSKEIVPTKTMFLFNTDWKLCLGYGKGLFQKPLIEHDF